MNCLCKQNFTDMNLYEKLADIKSIICLIDGVLTDGMYYVIPGNEIDFARSAFKQDIFGIRMARMAGIDFVLISGNDSRMFNYKMEGFGVETISNSSMDKLSDVENYCQQKGLNWNEVLFIGDDLVDLKLMEKVGLAACPSSATTPVQDHADYVSNAEGGKGCIREIVDILLEVKKINPVQLVKEGL